MIPHPPIITTHMTLQRRIKDTFGHDSLDWLDRAYLTDWIVVTIIWGLSWLASNIPVFEREFSHNDPLISHPHKHSQIGGVMNHNIALFVPVAIVTAIGGYRRSILEIHHGIISVLAGRGLARFITEFFKNTVGRLRPDFLARCKWDKVFKKCTGKLDNILDGRRSFPSGHSSAAFAGMTFLSLWLAGKTAAWCFHNPSPASSLRSSRMGKLFLSLLPLVWATFVAITRLEDYRHHKEDVIAGSIIGILSSTICYLMFWPSPFSASNFTQERSGLPRILYMDEHDRRSRPAGFELTRFEVDEIESV